MHTGMYEVMRESLSIIHKLTDHYIPALYLSHYFHPLPYFMPLPLDHVLVSQSKTEELCRL
jgi:hypothetical protein